MFNSLSMFNVSVMQRRTLKPSSNSMCYHSTISDIFRDIKPRFNPPSEIYIHYN